MRDLTLDTNTIYTHPSAIQCNAATEINSLKSSVSNGKSLIASAITGKGVSTASTATFQQMANNILSIPSKSAAEANNAHAYLFTADADGEVTFPPLGYIPSYIMLGQKRKFDEAWWGICAICNFPRKFSAVDTSDREEAFPGYIDGSTMLTYDISANTYATHQVKTRLRDYGAWTGYHEYSQIFAYILEQ